MIEPPKRFTNKRVKEPHEHVEMLLLLGLMVDLKHDY